MSGFLVEHPDRLKQMITKANPPEHPLWILP